MRTPHRKAAGVALTLSAALILTACQYLPNVALRLNEDGTLDFGSCEVLDSVSSVDAKVQVRIDDETAQSLLPPSLPSALTVGDVLHLGAPPPVDEWDRVFISVNGDYRERTRRIWGVFDLASLTPGEWSWAKSESNQFDRVKHCDLNG